jgi:DNA-binding NarL/FixJ family response regulator
VTSVAVTSDTPPPAKERQIASLTKPPTGASSRTPQPIQILLADDHAVLRAGLRALLDAVPNLHVVGEAATGEEAVEKAKALKPDVVVMDLVMPGIGGLEAMRRIAGQDQATKVLVLTGHLEEDVLLQVLEAGGSGYVAKMSTHEDLARAILTVVRDEVFLDPSATKLVAQRSTKTPPTRPDAALERLSAREREVLALTAAGHTSNEIAGQLGLSPKTVDTYRSRIMEKVGLRHRSELIRLALRTGLLRAE